jgi:DNA-directed RNA polymerase subunit RPC12/RpoP
MVKFRETSRKDWVKTIALISLAISAIAVGAIFLMLAYWYIWLLIVALIVLLLVRWHAKTYGYRCTKCGEEFGVSLLTELVSPHGISISKEGHSYGWYYLKCPKCGQSSKAIVIKKKEE